MGVKDLWTILAPVKQEKSLESLKGHILAIDLSVWICETQCVKQMQGLVTRPHLRNLFFRVQHLLQLGITPVFVVDGEAPELKWETMMKRTQARFSWRGGRRGGSAAAANPLRKQNRGHFKAKLRECCTMLDYMGVVHVQAEGEAEAMCAFLNEQRIVDGCITEDGDAFLYGATTVYRNFSVQGKDPKVECYRMSDIESQLGIGRQGLVVMGLLLGCDFCPKGVPGVGKEAAMKLIRALKGEDIIKRLKEWKHGTSFDQLDRLMAVKKVPHCGTCNHPGSGKEHSRRGCELCGSEKYCEPQSYDYECPCEWHLAQKKLSLRNAELAVRKKALELPEFPNQKVIDEFMKSRNSLPRLSIKWKMPQMEPIQKFAFQKMEWPEEYTQEKMLPMKTLWDMRNILEIGNHNSKIHLKPHCIVKTRVRQGIQSYEVQWHKSANDYTTDSEYYTTIEAQELFALCFPNVVYDFESVSATQKVQKKGGRRKNKQNSVPLDDALGKMANLSLLEEDDDVVITTNSKGEPRKKKPNKVKTSYIDDLDDLIDEEIKQWQTNTQVTETKPTSLAVKGKTNSNSSLKEFKDILGNTCSNININPEDLEEADLLALPLSQRLRLRSLQTTSSVKTSNSTAKKPTRSFIVNDENNEARESEHFEHDAKPVTCSTNINEYDLKSENEYISLLSSEGENNSDDSGDEFLCGNDEIVSGVLNCYIQHESSRNIEKDKTTSNEESKYTRSVADMTSNINNMSITSDELPDLVTDSCTSEIPIHTRLCNNATSTVCLYVNETPEKKMVVSINDDINDNGETQILELERDTYKRSENQSETLNVDISSANLTETVCLTINAGAAMKNNAPVASNETTLHCIFQDLTKTQIVEPNTTLSCGFKQPRHKRITAFNETRQLSARNNITRGCFDLETDFTQSYAEGETVDLTVLESMSSERKPPGNEVTVTRGCFDLETDFTQSYVEGETVDLTILESIRTEGNPLGNEVTVIVDSDSSGTLRSAKSTITNSKSNEIMCRGLEETVENVDCLDVSELPLSLGNTTNGQSNKCIRNGIMEETAVLNLCSTQPPGSEINNIVNPVIPDDTLICADENTVCLSLLPSDSPLQTDDRITSGTDVTQYIDVVNPDPNWKPGFDMTDIVTDGDNYNDTDKSCQGNQYTKGCNSIDADINISQLEDEVFTDVLDESCTEMDISLQGSKPVSHGPANTKSMDISLEHIHSPLTLDLQNLPERPTKRRTNLAKTFSVLPEMHSQSERRSDGGFPFCNETAEPNFVLGSSLISNLSDKSLQRSCSSSILGTSSEGTRFSSESSAHASSASENSIRAETTSKHVKLRKHRRPENQTTSNVLKMKKNTVAQSKIMTKNMGLLISPSYSTSSVNDSSILNIVDDIIGGQLPKKKSRKKIRKQNIENLFPEKGVSTSDDISILDLVDDIISSSQESVASKPIKKKKVRRKVIAK